MRQSAVRLVYHFIFAHRIVTGSARLLGKVLSPQRPELTRNVIPISGLPGQLDGFRFLHVADLHVRDGTESAAWLPDAAASVTYDMAVYTGDFVDGDEGIDPLAAVLSRMPQGPVSYAVLGNHDYWALSWEPRQNDTARLERVLGELGIQVLRNTAVPACEGALYIAGADDPVTGRDDVMAAMAAVPPGVPCVLLAHSPDVVLRLGGCRPSLVLAGHTHGGQVRLPILGPVVNMTSLSRRLAMGYHLYQGMPLFVSRGLGNSGVDLRVLCTPQVALLELRAV